MIWNEHQVGRSVDDRAKLGQSVRDLRKMLAEYVVARDRRMPFQLEFNEAQRLHEWLHKDRLYRESFETNALKAARRISNLHNQCGGLQVENCYLQQIFGDIAALVETWRENGSTTAADELEQTVEAGRQRLYDHNREKSERQKRYAAENRKAADQDGGQ